MACAVCLFFTFTPMKLFTFFILLSISAAAQDFNFQRSWGTYFGDERFFLKDSKTDRSGNLYIAGVFINGNSTSQPVFSTPNSYQPAYGGGESDGFIARFNNAGVLTWATYFGGSDLDNVSGLDFDDLDNVYVVGSTQSAAGIASAGASQGELHGISDFFIARFSEAGNLDWSTYYGGLNEEGVGNNDIYSYLNRIFISHDHSGYFYIGGNSTSPDLGTTGTFQALQEESDQIIAKFDNNGSHVWTTYYSFNGNYMLALKATTTALYVRGRINNCNPANPTDNGYYGSANGYQPTALNCSNTFLSKFDVTGQREWSTYYAENNSTSNKSLEVYQDKVYFTGVSFSNLVTTPGVFQESPGLEVPPYLVQFTESGTRDWGTYNGSNEGYPPFGGNYGLDHTTVDASGGVYLSGITGLHSNFATAGAYQTELIGQTDGYICKFGNQGQKIWGTYYGGNLFEYDMVMLPSVTDTFFVVGTSSSTTGLTTQGSHQPDLSTYDIENGTPQNIFIARFEPIPLNTDPFRENPFTIYPNPTHGHFTVALNNENIDQGTLDLYDVVGKKVLSQTLNAGNTIVNTNQISKGIYMVKVTAGNKSYRAKLVVD